MSQSGSYFGGGTPLPDVETLTGNSGGAVGSDANNNIFILGIDPINVTGDPGTNTLTVTVETATEVQLGVVTYATDAQTITGVTNSNAVHPQGLNAKLGDQTQFGIAYGNGATNTIQWTEAGQTGEVLLGDTGNPPFWSAAAEDGELLIGSTGNVPEWTTLTAGANVTISNLPGQVVISSTGGGGGTLGFQQVNFDTGVVVDDGSHIYDLLGDTNITTTGDGATTAQITLNDNVTILGTYRSLNGNLNLPTTTAGLAAGTIQWNGVDTIHTYGTNNMFVGVGSGNGTLTGQRNAALGAQALRSLTVGEDNIGIGAFGLNDLTDGQDNVSVGFQSLSSLTTGDGNVALGSSVATLLETGSENIMIGIAAGSSYNGNESNNILIANEGVNGESNVMRLGTDGTGDSEINETYIAGIYGRNPSTTAEVTMTDADGNMTTNANVQEGEVLISRSADHPVWNRLTAGPNVTITPGEGTIEIAASAAANNVIITKFTASGTWTKNTNAQTVTVIGWGGGGGGQGGSLGNTGSSSLTGRGGTGGTGGGMMYYRDIPAEVFAASETVTIAAGGPGGAAAFDNNTKGANGSAGARSLVGNLGTRTSPGGQQVQTGTNVGAPFPPILLDFSTPSSTEGLAFARRNIFGSSPGFAGIGGDIARDPSASRYKVSDIGFSGTPLTSGGASAGRLPHGSGGGGGGFFDKNGGRGGNVLAITGATIATAGTGGIFGGLVDGVDGPNRSSIYNGLLFGGLGGGGGAGANSAGGGDPGGNGGTGGMPGGGGGGGGIGLNNAFNAGSGGDGARGEVWIIEYL